MHHIYCPVCGLKLIDRKAGDEGSVPYCTACNRFWFDSFNSCAIVMVTNQHREVALLRQKYMSGQYMNFVSGYILCGETAEETAIREVKEELGLDLERVEPVGTVWFGKKEMLMHGYIGYTQKADFVLSPEVDEAEWVPVEQVPDRIFPDGPGNSQHPIYRQYIKSLK